MFVPVSRFPVVVIPLLAIVFCLELSHSGAIAKPIITTPAAESPAPPIFQEDFEPPNNGAPDESTGAGGR